jgi:beta-lactamase class A
VKEIRKYPYHLLVVAVALATGGLCGYYLSNLSEKICESKFEYINPDFSCDRNNVLSKGSYSPLRAELISYIEEQQDAGNAAEVAVFFRDLNSGPSFGINELADFAPASLLKMPLALSFLSYEEAHPGLLKEKLRYTKDHEVLEQITKPKESIKKDEWYTIEDVLYHMIVYSDNVSYGVLSEYIYSLPLGKQFVFQTYQDLGVIDPTNPLNETVTVQGYASIFRLLYNVSFVNKELSNKMLEWLVEADFPQGIIAGVPPSVLVADKFGERVLPDGKIQLHDCGIVYYPGNPYTLCIMTKGDDWDKLASVIRAVSRRVYNEVDVRRIK